MPASTPRRALLAALTLAALAATPSAASAAASVTITNDAGQPIPVPAGAPPVVRNMSPTVDQTFPAGETGRYTRTVTGPAGELAGFKVECLSKSAFDSQASYRGNGAYTITIQNYAPDDRSCTTPTSAETYVFGIQAGTTVTAPPSFSLRNAGVLVRNPVPALVGLNPGSANHELRYARNGVIGPDGGIAGASESGSVNAMTGQAQLFVSDPGVYTIVSRAKAFGGGVEAATPWSAPAKVVVTAPFDVVANILSFTDRRGPSYGVKIELHEKSARGRVRVSLARGSKGGKYRSIGSATISKAATVSKRFRASRPGTYRIRFTYGGSQTIRRGSAVFRITIRSSFF